MEDKGMNKLMHEFKKMSLLDKSYFVGIALLIMVLGINIVGTIVVFVEEITNQTTQPSSYSVLNAVSTKDYTDLMFRTGDSSIAYFQDDPEALECCYIGKYYEASLFAAAFTHDVEKQEMYEKQAEEAASHVSIFTKSLEDIDEIFAAE